MLISGDHFSWNICGVLGDSTNVFHIDSLHHELAQRFFRRPFSLLLGGFTCA